VSPTFQTLERYTTNHKNSTFEILDAAFDVSLVQNRGQMYYHQGSLQFPVVIMLQTINDNPALVQSQSTFATFRSNSDGTQSIAVIKQKIQVEMGRNWAHSTPIRAS
jgi:hypothetical protein